MYYLSDLHTREMDEWKNNLLCGQALCLQVHWLQQLRDGDKQEIQMFTTTLLRVTDDTTDATSVSYLLFAF